MTDRELLELAAKAAGYDVRYVSDGNGAGSFFMEPSGLWWGPNIDDGDALRLAVHCKIAVNPMTVDGLNRDQHESTAGCVKRWTSCIERHDGDPFAATRRAIVRAAAEIGKSMA